MTTANYLTEQELNLLGQVVAATLDNGVVYLPQATMQNLHMLGFVEFNAALIDPATGGIAFRARPEGLSYWQNRVAAASIVDDNTSVSTQTQAEVEQPIATAVTAQVKPSGVLVGSGGFEPPARRTRRVLNENRGYPFGSLVNIGDYFFVPKTAEKPKGIPASTISGANKRYAEFQPRRYFKAYPATQGQVFGTIVAPSDGVYVVRVEPPVEVPAPLTLNPV